MPKLHDPVQLDAVFAALSHQKRRAILHDLAFRPATVSVLAEDHGLSLPGIYKHLKVLEEAQLVIRKKAGRTNFVALNKRQWRAVQGWIMQYHTEWGNDEETLENYIASMRP
ncbi:MAG: transcriptional regulator [Patescibacteria group bacterium]|nr:transcriptional regulator [Patescibacteria group bacterium]